MESTTQNTLTKFRFQILSGSALKIIAIIIMFIDHIGAVVLYHGYLLPKWASSMFSGTDSIDTLYNISRFIGRIAFPIFCFLLVQGFVHTSNKRKYASRLLLFAIISEIPFDWAIYNSFWTLDHQNVFFTLLIGFCVLWLIELCQDNLILPIIIMALGMGLAFLLRTDYSYWGVLLICILYYFRNWPFMQTVAGSVSLAWEAPAILAFIPINMYNGKRGMSLKYFFYIFYPAHLLLLGGVRYLIFKV